jgi:hypothetical protein
MHTESQWQVEYRTNTGNRFCQIKAEGEELNATVRVVISSSLP